MKEYYYLISSLPTLSLDDTSSKPKITVSEFDQLCFETIANDEYKLIEQISLAPKSAMIEGDDDGAFLTNAHSEANVDRNVTIAWYKWEMCLRNSIAKKRALRNRDLSDLLQTEYDFFSEIERCVQNAYSSTNPLERENLFDNLRWNFLNELENNHQFDFGFLCVYKIKLLLVSKRFHRDVDVAYECLETVVENLQNDLEERTAK